MNKLTIYASAVCVIFLVTFICLRASAWKNADNIEFLKSYGWEVKTHPIETAEVTIPAEFDKVYADYNRLQIRAGLNLEPYRGKSGVRYCYEVTNYPKKTAEPVRANLIVIDNTPAAGDIMTVGLDGFMHSLYYEENDREK